MSSTQTLLLDDDALQLRILGRQLRNLGLPEPAASTQPDEALQWLRDEPARFGLVVCDLQMPGTDGLAVLRELARLGYRGAVLMASGEESEALQAAAALARELGLNCLGTVGKPVLPARLQQILAPLL